MNSFLKIAMYSLMEGKLERAIKYANKVLEVEENIEAMLVKAEALTRLGRIADSEKILDKVLKMQPDNIEAIQTKFMNCVWLLDLEEALHWADEGLKLDPYDFDLLIGRANVMYWLGDDFFCDYVERAREVDAERTESFLRNHWIWQDDIQILKMMEDFEEELIDGNSEKAIAIIDEALKKCADKRMIDQLKWLKASVLVYDGKIDEAKEVADSKVVAKIIASAEKAKKMSDDLLFMSAIYEPKDEIKESVEKRRVGLYEMEKIRKNYLRTLEKMPIEWLNGIAKNLGIKERKKKDRVRRILEVLNSKCDGIVRKLPSGALEALRFVMDRGGAVKYSELKKRFDCFVSSDWVRSKPSSAVGLLRSHGLLVVGVMEMDGRYCRVAWVPEELRGKIRKALESNVPTFELMDEYEALERVSEIHERAKKTDYGLTFRAVDALRKSRPEYYEKDRFEYNRMLIESAILGGKYEMVDDLLKPFLKDEVIDEFFDVIEMLMYHDYTEPLVKAMKRLLPQIRKSKEVLPHGKLEFENFLAMLILLNFLDAEDSEDAKDADTEVAEKVVEEMKPCWNVDVREVKEFLRLLSGGKREWRREDFYKSDGIFENLFLLCLEFVGRRRSKSRAMLGFYTLIDYLLDKKHWNSTRKNEVIVKLKKRSFEEYLSSFVLPFMPLRKYRLASLLEVVPSYIEFVKEKGLISEREYTRMLGLIPVVERYMNIIEI